MPGLQDRVVTVVEFADIYQFGVSHMSWAARNSIIAHQSLGLEDSPSGKALVTFKGNLDIHAERRDKVEVSRNKGANPLLVKADRKVDVTYGHFVRRLRAAVELHGIDSERGQAAARMLQGLLGRQISSVTQVDRFEQEYLLKRIIAEIEERFVDEVETLELNTHYKMLKDDTDNFSRLMTRDVERRRLPSLSELEEERKDLQAEMVGCIFLILGTYPRLNEEDIEMRSALVGPFAIQNDRIGEYLRRRRGGGSPIPPAVDDDTGEFPDEEQEPTEPVVADPQPLVT